MHEKGGMALAQPETQAKAPVGMQEKTVKSALPFYLAALVWVIGALFLPFHLWYVLLIVAAVSAAVFFTAEKLIPPKTIWVPVEEKPAETGDEAADEVLTTGRKYLADLIKADEAIEDEPVSMKIRRIAYTAERIFDYVQEHPEAAPKIRKFMQYYLPTLLKLLASYDTMEEQGISGENMAGTMRGIEQILDTIIVAFDKQLDNLFAQEALDISTDITVLETLLAQEGLVDKGFTIQKDESPNTERKA